MGIKQKMEDLIHNKSLMSGVLFSLFSFVNQGLNFLLLLVLANYITPAEYGYLGLFNTVVMVVGYFRVFSTEGYISVAFFSEGEPGIKNTISCIFSTSIITTALLVIILFLFGDKLSEVLDLPLNVLYLSIIICFFTLYSNLNLDYVRIKEKVQLYGTLSCSNALLNFIISLVFVRFLMMGWEGRVYAQSICFFIYGFLGLVIFFYKGYVRKPNLQYLKSMLIWGIPLIPHLATSFIRQGCDRYIINASHTIEDVGLFTFAFTLTNVITMIGFGFNQSNSVDIYKILGSNDISNEEKGKKIVSLKKTMFIVYSIAALFATVACYIIIPILLPRYEGAMNYFLILALYGFGVCIYLIYTNYLFFFKKTRTIMYITFLSAILHLIISLIATRYSLYYTCIAYVFTQIIVIIMIRHFANNIIRNKIYEQSI